MNEPPWLQPAHARLLADSFRHWSGRTLLPDELDPGELARRLYEAPFALLSHGTEVDPLFNYVNRTAQGLWELDWAAMIGMPSRHSAEPAAQAERAGTLGVAGQAGWVEGYSGVRISARGRRFRIRDGIIWTLVDGAGTPRGQAATFAQWEFL